MGKFVTSPSRAEQDTGKLGRLTRYLEHLNMELTFWYFEYTDSQHDKAKERGFWMTKKASEKRFTLKKNHVSNFIPESLYINYHTLFKWWTLDKWFLMDFFLMQTDKKLFHMRMSSPQSWDISLLAKARNSSSLSMAWKEIMESIHLDSLEKKSYISFKTL